MSGSEYLVSFGAAGDFSRFRAVPPETYARGDRVVVRSHQGLELGVVLCATTAEHERFLSHTAVGEVLRPANGDDERAAARARELGKRLFEDGRRLTAQMQLPLEILDVEVLLDGRQATIYHLRPGDCDYRPLVSTLASRHDILIVMQNLALPAEEKTNGCGKPDCGQAGGGGCSSCGSGGGCSAGSCGKHVEKEQVAEYLAALKPQTADRSRTALL
jgi:cell fate regulator YaaT (PSP1 superfamily)